MTKDEALKLALEVLEEGVQGTRPLGVATLEAITAIKEALAQPEQEYHAVNAVHKGQQCYVKTQPKEPEHKPVAWMNDSTPSGIFARHIDGARNFGCTIPLYITPPQRTWVGLTDIDYAGLPLEQVGLVRWAEAKLKEKNT